ncbi:MAG: VacB/RNase II family 3'-5' exoribonuclease [Phycisphaeraceae bacterium]|nr:VacB/RNase II family 3'-5' exoribonuclease [Phycisphaeraceae bacterium]
MALKYENRLLTHLADENYRERHIAMLADELRVEDLDEFKRAVFRLAEQGRLKIDDSGRVSLPSLSEVGDELEGEFRKAAGGFGFVEPTVTVRERRVFIPPRDTGDAMSGDTVRIRVRRDTGRERRGGYVEPQFRGEIIEVVRRRRTSFSGEVMRQGGQWIVQPDGKLITQPIVVPDAESKNVKPGDKVVVDITHFPEGSYLAEGVISKVLGDAGRPDVETQAVIAAHNLPGEFPDAALDDAREAARRYEEEMARFEAGESLQGRRDLTGDFILTIDPPDAKDYDDALSIEGTRDGWRLGVHIADVAHFIEPGSALDLEAQARGNSVYLPRLVIPMLPEILSNGICSLQEGVKRYCKSAFMEYDRRGNVRREGVAQTLISSRKRLTYLEAQALIDGDETEAKNHARTEPRYTPELLGALKDLNAMSRAIRERRERQGMISLDLPDVELIFDEEGRVIDAQKEDDAYTHTLIEMCMVEANEVLARLFEGLHVPVLRRVHPEPTPGETDTLRKVAMVAGFRIPSNPTREELQSLLNSTRGTPAARPVHLAVLRTLTRAEYSPALIGHFALASSAYSHFTSPIRRYPDLTVHRALAAYLGRTDNGENPPRDDGARKRLGRDLMDLPECPAEDELVVLGRACSATEENAEEAERELRQFLVLQLLADKVGEVFDGVVTGVVPRGVFVQIDKYLADGMIKASDLPGDTTRGNRPPRWAIDDRTGALVDQHSGRSFSMGDSVRVTIAAVDLARRQMDLLIADGSSRAAGKAKGLKIGQGEGGLGGGRGAGFGDMRSMTGGQRRSAKSKRRDKGKADHRRDDKKKKGR